MNPVVPIFQTFRRILCICPNCQTLSRLSDLRLKYTGKAPQTWLDTFEGKRSVLEGKENTFEEKEQKIREEAIERGRKKVPTIISRAMSPDLRNLRYNPYDIKAVLNPVDFVVFDGLTAKEEIRNITFLSKNTDIRAVNEVRNSVTGAIQKGNYDWRVARVSSDGKVQFSDK